MHHRLRTPLGIDDENVALRAILEGTATDIGERFFASLVEHLCRALGTYSAWVTEFNPETRELQSLAFWMDGRLMENFRMPVDGTPCASVIDATRLILHSENVINLYPHCESLKAFSAVSYLGAPLLDRDLRVLGNLAVLDRRVMPDDPRAVTVFRIFADRAAAELQRLRTETRLRKSEETYRRIVETTTEGFLLLDPEFRITDANDAFCRLVGHPREAILGKSPLDFATDAFRRFLLANSRAPLVHRLQGCEGTLQSRTGRILPVHIYGDSLEGDDGTPIGFMYFIIDVSQQKRSLALAGDVQRSLLPMSSPRLEGYDIAGTIASCEEIGGDYFDYLWDADGAVPHLDVVVGDVAGHGVEAALLMTAARALLRMQAQVAPAGSASAMVTGMNRQFARDLLDTGRFMTLFLLRIDADGSGLRWVRAGHPPALVYEPRRDRFRTLMGEGVALGVDGEYAYREQREPGLKDGDMIVIGTDGIWEAMDRHQKPFGAARFRDALRNRAGMGARGIVEGVLEDVRRFSLGAAQQDDLTLVVVKKRPAGAPFPDFQI